MMFKKMKSSFLIMEYIDGPTLSEYIHSHGPLSVDTAIDFTNQILKGVAQAHENLSYIEI